MVRVCRLTLPPLQFIFLFLPPLGLEHEGLMLAFYLKSWIQPAAATNGHDSLVKSDRPETTCPNFLTGKREAV